MAVDSTAAERAKHSLMLGRVDEAVIELGQTIAADPRNGAAHLLLCRAFYAQESAAAAVGECEAALANGLANDSHAQDWMGRAYGMKADRSGPLTGLSLAKKVKAAFEKAVQLDPENGGAANDLSEYYVAAPSIVGGGLDKATALAARVEARLPQQAHRMRAFVARKKKDYVTAEREFRAAVSVAGRADAWTDLGDFYARRGQSDQAVAALHNAVEANAAADASLLDAASILGSIHREPRMAMQALRQYLASNAMSDAGPAFKAHYQLGKLLEAEGNKPAAKSEYEAALALAANYAPARNALQAH
ncbi:MAG: hypothetical protein M3R43_05260 [Acidobacteriota bacterium]|nr:hypothetical protein [Acidobacteriota bacterium]